MPIKFKIIKFVHDQSVNALYALKVCVIFLNASLHDCVVALLQYEIINYENECLNNEIFNPIVFQMLNVFGWLYSSLVYPMYNVHRNKAMADFYNYIVCCVVLM